MLHEFAARSVMKHAAIYRIRGASASKDDVLVLQVDESQGLQRRVR